MTDTDTRPAHDPRHTTLLFNEDPYRSTASSVVVEVDGDDVVLAETIFYPEGGGQAADHGWIDDLPVAALRRIRPVYQQVPRGDSVIVRSAVVHTVPGHRLGVGDTVELRLDASRRLDNMKMHTLAHLLFIATRELLESRGQVVRTKGCQIEGRAARFDFSADIAADDVPGVAARVRELIASIGSTRVVIDETGVRRWIGGDAVIACGGTHVHDTRELDGEVVVRRRRKGSGLTRLYVERVAASG